MTSILTAACLPTLKPLPRGVREVVFGFFYWVFFLLVLEPDNVLRASRAGYTLAIGHEALRIAGASLLGATVTPIVVMLARRFPVRGTARLHHGLLHLGAATGLAFALVVTSCFAAAWGFYGEWLPSSADLITALVSNWLLLVYALCALTAIVHAAQWLYGREQPQARNPDSATYLSCVPVKSRGRTSIVELQDIDWIETRGNYLALHAGTTVHMIREASIAFEARLDPARFLRIHRRVIVALDRIKDLQPITNGDSMLRLLDGQELRASRSYRKAIHEHWPLRNHHTQ